MLVKTSKKHEKHPGLGRKLGSAHLSSPGPKGKKLIKLPGSEGLNTLYHGMFLSHQHDIGMVALFNYCSIGQYLGDSLV